MAARMVSFRRSGVAMVVSARRREMNGVRNDIRSAAGLAGGSGANGDKNGVVSAQGGHFGLFGKGGGGRLARRKPPWFFPKKARKNISGNM